jgi:hypothetical protein
MTTPTLTPTCQKAVSTTNLIAALEACWTAIGTHNPELPAAVIVLGSGSTAKPTHLLKWGHFAALRWQHNDTKLPEILISGEGLSRTPAEILATLLHEGAHALADALEIKDTSRQGRYHNKRFAQLANTVGLIVTLDPKFGWSPSELAPGTADLYADELAALTEALTVYRHREPLRQAKRKNSNNGLACECLCERKIRVSKAVYDAGPILCGLCNTAFLSDEPDDTTEEGDNE